MANKTRYTVELLDKISAPAKRIGARLDKLIGAARVKATRRIGKAFEDLGPKVKIALFGKGKGRDEAGRFTKGSKGILSSLGGLGGGFDGLGMKGLVAGNLISSGIERATGAMLELGRATVGVVAEYTKFAQNSELAFNRLAKHGASGAKLFAHARGLAVEFGLDVQDTSDNFRKLLAAQFNPKLATDIIKMGADLRSLGGNAEDVKGAVRAISQIKGTGKLQGDELNQLAEAGLSVNLIREEIGKIMGGKSIGEVLKLQEAGKIDADTAVAGILNAVKAKTGSKELGEAGKLFADTTLDGMGGRLKSLGQNLMVDLGQRMVPVITKFAGPLAQRLSAFLTSPEAQAGIDRFVAGVERGFTIAQVVLSKVVPLGERFFNGFIAKVGPAMPGLAANAQGFMAALDKPELAEAMGRWGERLGVVASMLLKIGGFALEVIPSLLRLGDAVQRPFDVIRGAAEKVIGLAATWGPAIVDGLVRGLEAGVDRVAAAASKVAGAVTGKLQSIFNFGSPSKYMAQRGEWISEGLQIGMDRVSPVPDWLGASAVNDFGPRASSFTMPPVSGSGVGVNVTYAPVYEIQQQPGQSPDELVDELSERNRRDFEDMLEELALAVGA
jgi:tape measure domain-containing protein